jgi:NAD-dependent SIR2 family protein deacetylase
MTWFYKAKQKRTVRPERCQRCHARAPTEEIRMLWQAREMTSADEARDWWLCAECAAELRPGAPSTS